MQQTYYKSFSIAILIATITLLSILINTHTTSATTVKAPTVNYYAGLTNREIKRIIDIRTNLEEVLYEIEVENTGKSAAQFYLLPILAEKSSHFSFARASAASTVLEATIADVKGLPTNSDDVPEGTRFIQVQFAAPLASGASLTFQVLLVFTHTLQPYPAQITQYEDQKVQYFDNHYVLSPYPTDKQTSQAKLTTANIESRSNEKPTKTNKDVIEYGPYKDIKPFSYSKMTIHFESNTPFVTITNCVREVEVSHWGNVAFEETYELKNTGAALKGSFSRLDYQRGQGSNSKSSFRTIAALLPSAVRDMYYRDNIGNISTSHVRKTREGTLFEVSPRFPMFGGWKTDFFVGYSIRSNKALSHSPSNPNHYILNITFSTSFAQAAVDSLTLRVTLPEGATDIRYVSPFPMDEEDQQIKFTYLDTTGRPVLVLSKHNLCRYHNQFVQVSYTFTKTAIYHKPLMMIAAFFVFFVFIIVVMRLELSISSKMIVIRRDGKIGEAVTTLLDKFQEFEKLFANAESERTNSLLKDIFQLTAEIKKNDVSLGDVVEKLEDALTKLKNVRSQPVGKTVNKYQQTLNHVEVLLSDLAGL